MIELVVQMHSIENMYATLVMLGITMVFLLILGYVYVRYHGKHNVAFWLIFAILVVIYCFCIYGSQIWCIDMGWISPGGDMTNMTKMIK